MVVENCDNDSNKPDFILHILISFNDGTFGISTGQSFFKPVLPPKSGDTEDWVTLLKSWLNSKKAIAVRWPGDNLCNSWNLLDYAAEAPSKTVNDKSLMHSNAILKSGVIVFFSESEDEMRKERDKLILQATDKKYLKTKDGKQKFGYPTTRQPVANKKSVRAEKSTNLQPDALADDDLSSSPLKSLEDVIPPSTEKKRKEKKKSTSRSMEKSAASEEILHTTYAVNDELSSSPPKSLEEDVIPPSTEKKGKQKKKSTSRPMDKSATSEVKLNTTAVNDNLLSSSTLQSLEEDEIHETTGKRHNQREKSISIGKSPTSEISLHPAVNDKSSSSKTSSEEDEIDHATILDSSASSNFDSKLAEYEAKCDKLERENRALKEKIAKNEVEIETYYNEVASKELQNMELCEQLEAIQKAQPIELIKEMKDAIAEMGQLIHNSRIQPTQGQHLNQQQASSSSAGNLSRSSNTGPRMKKLWGEVMVSDSCIRKIAIALKTDQMTDTCRNRIAALILDDLYTVDELANMSLSGRKCPGQDREAKPKLPQNIITAIHNYMQKIWDEAFTTKDEKNNVKSVAVITEKQINNAICAKLIGCHNLKKKISQKPKSQPSNSITTAVGSDVE